MFYIYLKWILFHFSSRCRNIVFSFTETVRSEETLEEKAPEEEFTYPPVKPVVKIPKARYLSVTSSSPAKLPRDAVFEATSFTTDKPRRITLKIKNCRSKEVPQKSTSERTQFSASCSRNVVMVANGLLTRFRYRLSEPSDTFPIFGALTL